jgi:peroxiredoxin (alkyl hydroperoxide reductase subunit C)
VIKLAKKKKFQLNWSENQVFDYKLIKHPEKNKSHVDKREELIKEGEVECSEWWLCWRKN